MGWIHIKQYEKIDVDESTAVLGFPGIGSVGRNVATYLIDIFKPVRLFDLYSEHLYLPGSSLGVIVKGNGLLELPSIQAYLIRRRKNDLIIVTSSVQPAPWAQFTVLDKLVEILEGYNCRLIVSLSGFYKPDIAGKILATGETKHVEYLLKLGATNERIVESIIGAAGVILAVARLRGISHVSLTAVTENEVYDLRATRQVLHLLDKWLNLNVDFSSIDRNIRELNIMSMVKSARTPPEYVG